MEQRDFSTTRSNSYQHIFAEINIDSAIMANFSDSEKETAEEKEIRLDKEEKLLERTWILAKEHLTENQFNIMNLYYKQGMTQVEISKIKGCNQSSVTKNLIGNISYTGQKTLHGGSLKKLKTILFDDPEIRSILELEPLPYELPAKVIDIFDDYIIYSIVVYSINNVFYVSANTYNDLTNKYYQRRLKTFKSENSQQAANAFKTRCEDYLSGKPYEPSNYYIEEPPMISAPSTITQPASDVNSIILQKSDIYRGAIEWETEITLSDKEKVWLKELVEVKLGRRSGKSIFDKNRISEYRNNFCVQFNSGHLVRSFGEFSSKKQAQKKNDLCIEYLRSIGAKEIDRTLQKSGLTIDQENQLKLLKNEVSMRIDHLKRNTDYFRVVYSIKSKEIEILFSSKNKEEAERIKDCAIVFVKNLKLPPALTKREIKEKQMETQTDLSIIINQYVDNIVNSKLAAALEVHRAEKMKILEQLEQATLLLKQINAYISEI